MLVSRCFKAYSTLETVSWSLLHCMHNALPQGPTVLSSTNMACSWGRLFACMPSLYIQRLIIVFPLYALVTFSKCPPSPQLSLLPFPPSQNSIGQPLRALPSSQLIPPTLNLLPPPDHLSHFPLDQQHLHSVSRCSIHCCQYILTAHGGSWPSPSFKETGRSNSCRWIHWS